MPDYTNELNALKARRRASATTAIVLFVFGLVLAGIGFLAAAGSAFSQKQGDATSGVLFGIGVSLFIIGIILFVKTRGITSKINGLERRFTTETTLSKDNLPANGEKRSIL